MTDFEHKPHINSYERYIAAAARLGSISPTKMNTLPLAIQKILEEDAPWFYQIAKAAIKYSDDFAECTNDIEAEATAEELRTALEKLGV